MKAKRRNTAGLTADQLKTVHAIARERGLELPDDWARDRAYCTALLDGLAIDRQRHPLPAVVRFVNDVTRQVEAGATAADLARKYELPPNFAATMHAYAVKQLGYSCRADWLSDLERLNAALADEDALG
jgi:hypothetical protein